MLAFPGKLRSQSSHLQMPQHLTQSTGSVWGMPRDPGTDRQQSALAHHQSRSLGFGQGPSGLSPGLGCLLEEGRSLCPAPCSPGQGGTCWRGWPSPLSRCFVSLEQPHVVGRGPGPPHVPPHRHCRVHALPTAADGHHTHPRLPAAHIQQHGCPAGEPGPTCAVLVSLRPAPTQPGSVLVETARGL